ncbi:FadR/GntR family transcriptional regulator [Sphingobium limneticum]|jgi:GntR family transcriptional repressor for pyruvate dehydrogenase complex|uniref:FadR/GntR family transcriptional regulator n=2 Tax=Sphingomonadaceae TaxID=41297 RepID=UPI000DBB92CA|nr:GntR family transcriptional regulator [Sphingobium limneticum]BBC99920.1 GntR family transcriptional regulator, transcriptional repressor for pyruvate dehydrogenase complex [Sphingobium sp. YG1]
MLVEPLPDAMQQVSVHFRFIGSPDMKTPSAIPNFAPIRTQRAFEVICEQIRAQLAAGTLKTGDKLPAERELAAEFQVSRSALREALRSLEVAGIIRNVKGVKGGSFIQSAEPDRIVQAMQDYVHLGNISLDELTEARLATQDIIVRLACERASDADLAELEAIAERTRQESDVEARYECAAAYYRVLARATKNRMFGIFVDSLSAILHEFVQGPDYETLQETLIESRFKLVRHLRARDADAAAAEMRKHLERVHRHVRKTLKAQNMPAKAAKARGKAPA